MYSLKTIIFWILVLYVRAFKWFERGLLHILKSPINKYIKRKAAQHGIIINGQTENIGQRFLQDEDDPETQSSTTLIPVQVHHEHTFLRIINESTMGLVESYMEGWWECEQLEELTIRLGEIFEGMRPHPLLRLMDWITLNSDERPWEDSINDWASTLCADFFGVLLGEYKLYSCGYWKNASTLEQAHLQNMKLIGEKLSLVPGLRVLDLGCGYGALSRFLSNQFNVEVIGCTNSSEEIVEAKKYPGSNVKMIKCDYKDLSGKFDRIVCVQMLEHLGGPRHYKQFFETISNYLTDDGLFILQSTTITISGTLRSEPFGRKYLLKNSVAPHYLELMKATEGNFLIEDVHNIGAHMEKTLQAYLNNLEIGWEQTLSKKFDIKYYKMFELYLKVMIAGVKMRKVQMWQIVLSKQNLSSNYESVR